MSAFSPLSRLVSRGAVLLAVLVTTCMLASARGAAANGEGPSDPTWTWPLSPTPAVIHPFDPPDSPYGAGNRGVDLAGSVGQPVFAIGEGEITYAGVLAGRGVVVVTHGAVRSTYEPVVAAVSAGDHVGRGQPIGMLTSVGSHCPPQACLHLGVLRGAEYLDPLSLLGSAPIRLKPTSGESAAPASRGAHDAAVAAAGYRWPVVR